MANTDILSDRDRAPFTAEILSSQAVFAVEEERRIVLWNNSAEAILGFSSKEVLGHHCWEVLKGCDNFGRPLPCHLCQRFLEGDISNLALRQFFVNGKDGQTKKLSHEVILLPEGPGARALVLMKPMGYPLIQDPISSQESVPPAAFSNDSWDIVKGLAALGIIAHDAAGNELSLALDSSLKRVLSVTGAESAELFLFNEPSKEMFLTTHQGLFRSAFCQIRRFKLGQGFPGLIAASGEPIITSELIQEPRYLRTQVKEKGIHFYLCVPLKTQQGIIGSINIASRRKDLDAQRMLQFLTWIARPLSSAIQLDWLQKKETVYINGIDITQGAAGDAISRLDNSLEQILSQILAAGHAEGGRIVLGDAVSGVIHHEVQQPSGFSGSCVLSRKMSGPECESPSGQCPALVSSSPVEIFRDRRLPEVSCRGILKDMPGVICVPLKAGDVNFGAVSLAYSDKDELLTRYMAIAGIMVDRAARILWPRYQQARAIEAPASIISKKPVSSNISPKSTVPLPNKQVYLLDIQCLGSFRVRLGGRLLTARHFRRRQALTVFKILIAHRGHRVTSEFLTECLWPEVEPETAKNRLWVAIHDLRRTLKPQKGKQPEIIRTDGQSYYFNTLAPQRLDADEFVRGMKEGKELEAGGNEDKALNAYKKAARLYRGAFMEEESYCDWCSTEREYLREVYFSLLKRIANLYEGKKDYEKAINYYRLALSQDNLREELHRSLMSCLWQAGRGDEALVQYKKCREILSKELGVEPLEETRALYRKILTR